MLNETMVVGRITDEVVTRKTESGKDVTNITVAVPKKNRDSRSYSKGNYETTLIFCILKNSLARSVAENCIQGDLIAIKGVLQSKEIETKNGDKVSTMELVAEKATFMFKRKKTEKNNNIEDVNNLNENIKI
jgi:single stranded DNA-binding protein (ssb)